jgi:putative ABC transport system permease protein
LDLIKNKWEQLVPEQPFNFYFQDEAFDSQYRSDEKLGEIISNFAILAIIVSCLGLFGISVHSAQRRIKEIGIRKVLGASTSSITRLFASEFLVLVFISCIIAWPIAYYLIDKWLGNFAYRIEIGWLVFGLSTCATVMIGLLTISFQAIKAARTNPVETLKYE